MAYQIILEDTVSGRGTEVGGGGAFSIVGDPPVWKDDSDATYAQLPATYFGDGQPQFFGNANCFVDAASTAVDQTIIQKVLLRIRLAGTAPGQMWPRAGLSSRVSGVGGASMAIKTTRDCPISPEWVEADMRPALEQAGLLDDFAAAPSTFAVEIQPPSYDSPVPSGNQFWNIYEVRLIVTFRMFDAPPCRIFPREDGLGVGAGRNYPPPKSQQRSSRGVGYY